MTVEISETDTGATNIAKLIAVTKQYTCIDELMPEILNAFMDKIVIDEREKKDGKRMIPMSRLLIFKQTEKCVR